MLLQKSGIDGIKSMRILIEVTHPAHVHFFRNAIIEFQKRGHTVAVTARGTSITVQLLKNFRIPYTELNARGSARVLSVERMLVRDFLLWKFCRNFKPDILTSIGGAFAAHVGALSGKPVVVWDDTEHYKIAHKITWPFATAIYSPDCYLDPPVKKQHFYPGCHELAYLHPKRFTPDVEVVKGLGIDPEEKYGIIRLVGWGAQHDIGQHGFDKDKKLEFVKAIAQYARPYITSEKALPPELNPYTLKIPVQQIHHVMAFASLCVGEGATMASESAVLGVPAVYINTLKLGYINMLEKYGLIKQTTDTQKALRQSLDWLSDPETKEKCRVAREKFLAEKIDVTGYIVETIEQVATNKLRQ